MLAFPNCKINLGLNITRKRSDGYHDLETIFYPVALRDALEISRTESKETSIVFQQSGLAIAGEPGNNLCVKAWHLLKKDFPNLPAIQLYLHKIIPMGAGLGGGSADGAFALGLINRFCQLELGNEQLAVYALELGSDCPFFIYNQPCYATGRGEELTPIDLDLSAYTFVLVHPGVHVSTAAAFAKLIPHAPVKNVRDIVQLPVASWKQELINDFELPVSNEYPVIANIKEKLYNAGAVYASMTGSGSTLYALFRKGERVQLPGLEEYAVSILG